MTRPLTLSAEIESTDIFKMKEMTEEQYAAHLENHLIWSDPHGNVRATQGDYPIACTKTQLTILINYLEAKRGSLES